MGWLRHNQLSHQASLAACQFDICAGAVSPHMLSVGCVVKQLPLQLMPATGMAAQGRPAATAPPDGARGPAAGQPANQGNRQADWRIGRAQWPRLPLPLALTWQTGFAPTTEQQHADTAGHAGD